MHSIPIKIGSDLHHLRYPISAVTELNMIIPGGFYSVFDMDADIETCHLLLYYGLRHEGVTYEQAGMMLVYEGAAYDSIALVGFWKKITDALVLDSWISVEQSKPESARSETATMEETIADMEREAVGKLNISISDFYGLTPREFNVMLEKKGASENWRAGLICATIANALVPKKSGGVWQVSNFIHTGETPKVQTVDQQRMILSEL